MRKVKNERMSPVMMVVVVAAVVHCAEQLELTGDNVCTTKVTCYWAGVESNKSNSKLFRFWNPNWSMSPTSSQFRSRSTLSV